jgi:hypothetical protein
LRRGGCPGAIRSSARELDHLSTIRRQRVISASTSGSRARFPGNATPSRSVRTIPARPDWYNRAGCRQVPAVHVPPASVQRPCRACGRRRRDACSRAVSWVRLISSPPSITVEVMSNRRPISEAELETLQGETFDFFVHEANPANGLIIDKTAANWPAASPPPGWRSPPIRLVSRRIFCRGASRWSAL